MRVHNFFTEIAFIPWNYKKSDAETVTLLANNTDRFSICVHGCDHVNDEFGGMNYKNLRTLSSTALWRMEQHKVLTGLSYDPVMVFPMGRFSSVAMLALKDEGYYAAFNSTLLATDQKAVLPGEYQRPATAMYHGLPLFLRRYPKERFPFVQDIDCGRPIIVVEHHSAFRNGYKALTDFVDWVNSLGSVRWTSLMEIAEHYTEEKKPNTRKSVGAPLPPLRLNARVALRRLFCEVRDNHIETSSLLTKVYKMVRGCGGELFRSK
jgi:hypothetical protein